MTVDVQRSRDDRPADGPGRSSRESVFILSLDCEGLWGMADHQPNELLRLITRTSLLAAYRRMIGMLDDHGIAATFSVVGAFTLPPERFASVRPMLDESAGHRSWMGHVDRFVAAEPDGAWHLPEVVDLVDRSGRHEWSTHGFTHLPFGHPEATDDACDLELRLATSMSPGTVTTMVFPRNQVRREHLLPAHGIRGYREASTLSGRVRRLADEFHPRPSPQAPAPRAGAGETVRVPSGYLLNWRHSARRLVPPALTRSRIDALLRRTVREGGVAHLWFHPHNLLTGNGQFELFGHLLSSVVALRASGLTVQTMAEHVESRR